MKNKQICSFYECKNEVCEAGKNTTDRMRFCQQHYDEISGYIRDSRIPKIVGFWIKANGGAKKLSETF